MREENRGKRNKNWIKTRGQSFLFVYGFDTTSWNLYRHCTYLPNSFKPEVYSAY
jgi:hypothetical protein